MASDEFDVCSRCDEPLPEPFDDGAGPGHALILRLDGGYGMFVDPGFDDEDEWVKVLCHGCGHEFADFMDLDAREWHEHSSGRAWDRDHHRD